MKTLENIRKLPVETRKIILWAIVIFIFFVFLFFWFKNFQKKIDNLRQSYQEVEKETNFPNKEIPKFETLKDSEELLKEIEKAINQELEEIEEEEIEEEKEI